MKFGVLHCDYDEPKTETYRGMYVTRSGEEVFRASSGDQVEDHRACIQYLVDNDLHVLSSSSVDNYYLDDKEDDPDG